jgi:hypothetical protein
MCTVKWEIRGAQSVLEHLHCYQIIRTPSQLWEPCYLSTLEWPGSLLPVILYVLKPLVLRSEWYWRNDGDPE